MEQFTSQLSFSWSIWAN